MPYSSYGVGGNQGTYQMNGMTMQQNLMAHCQFLPMAQPAGYFVFGQVQPVNAIASKLNNDSLKELNIVLGEKVMKTFEKGV
eukprot:CAMPEP_0205819596 /NCGR_PEP_ID=MMETSP0206-20130828/2038_1 /ASSEMBLY_ACC=CAM_ASM_000279 /TAXON_ID=36767 /ORGANISM="Euplotes focardii, Strain TN1" /LENGTH=81 /DNA_ID=CAMNT_0053113385 /DNA_START=336 /DNA_END=581 /DNA_ORIENTATION=-